MKLTNWLKAKYRVRPHGVDRFEVHRREGLIWWDWLGYAGDLEQAEQMVLKDMESRNKLNQNLIDKQGRINAHRVAYPNYYWR